MKYPLDNEAIAALAGAGGVNEGIASKAHRWNKVHGEAMDSAELMWRQARQAFARSLSEGVDRAWRDFEIETAASHVHTAMECEVRAYQVVDAFMAADVFAHATVKWSTPGSTRIASVAISGEGCYAFAMRDGTYRMAGVAEAEPVVGPYYSGVGEVTR